MRHLENLAGSLPDITGIYDTLLNPTQLRRMKKPALLAFAAAITLLIIILFARSTYKIEQNQLAFTENQITANIDGPYTQGLYVWKPADRVVRFERIFQQKVMDVKSMTYDKLKFIATISFQYEYQPINIVPTIWMEFQNEDNYLLFFERNVTTSIITTCAKYNATDYYDSRGIVEKQMENDLVRNLNFPGSRFGAEIKGLQLKNIRFPIEFTRIIERRQIIDQDRVTAINARVSLLINANTTLLRSQQQASIIQTQADNAAQVIQTSANATAEIIWARWMRLVLGVQENIQRNNLTFEQAIAYLNQDTFSTKASWVDFGKFVSK